MIPKGILAENHKHQNEILCFNPMCISFCPPVAFSLSPGVAGA
jgi:hypothetical protein